MYADAAANRRGSSHNPPIPALHRPSLSHLSEIRRLAPRLAPPSFEHDGGARDRAVPSAERHATQLHAWFLWIIGRYARSSPDVSLDYHKSPNGLTALLALPLI